MEFVPGMQAFFNMHTNPCDPPNKVKNKKHMITSKDEKTLLAKSNTQDIPGGPVVKNLRTSSEDTVSVPALGRFHMPWGN